MLTFKHYTVAVHDLDEAVGNYQSRFGMQPIGDRRQNRIGNFEAQPMGYGDAPALQLIQPLSEEGPIARLMGERGSDFNPHGEGLYLVAYECDDVDAFCDQVTANGGRVSRVEGAPNAWIHPTASHYVLMEIFPKST
jgi:catechol 2,3-dioxygenase-like lactoylglutathione lyase family enzyme